MISDPAELFEPEIPAVRAFPYFTSVIDPAVGIVRGVRQRDDWPHDEPKTIMYRAELMPTASFSSGGYSTIPAEAGRAVDHETARASALFEAVERYCLSIYDADSLRVASYRELRSAGVPAIDPTELAHSGTWTDELRDRKFAWTSAVSIKDGATRLVPAQLVYLPYAFPDGELVLRDPLTTGCAAGMAVGPAILRGLLEVIERDATMIHHYRQIRPRRLPSRMFGSAELDGLVRQCARYHLDVELFDYTLDLPVPVIAARVVDRTGGTPAMTVGSKASFDVADAAVGAVLEAVTFRGPVRSRAQTARAVAEELMTDPGRITSGSERAFLWIQPEMRDCLGYLDEAQDGVGLPVGDPQELIQAVGGDILVCDVTTPDIRELGAVVVKVIVPRLQPMHLSEVDRRWTDRLLRFGDPVTVDGLNPLPHPFL